MAATDNLNQQQFSTWYHGTGSDAAAGIKQRGLINEHYLGSRNSTLSTYLPDAAEFASMRAHGHPGVKPAIVEFHIPDSKLDEYTEGGNKVRGLRKRLPPDMVHKVTEWDE